VKYATIDELIDQLKEKGIRNPDVLRAIAETPREEFVAPSFRWRAYTDEALPIDCGQTISQPYTVAVMTEALQPFKGMKVLEIGTGSGYQAAVLSSLGVRVWSIERQADLFRIARERFDRAGIPVATKLGDGSVGWSEFAPYDGILVTAGAPTIPDALTRQLAVGGRLVIPVGNRQEQRLNIVTRVSDDEFETDDVGEFRFVPLIGKRGWEE